MSLPILIAMSHISSGASIPAQNTSEQILSRMTPQQILCTVCPLVQMWAYLQYVGTFRLPLDLLTCPNAYTLKSTSVLRTSLVDSVHWLGDKRMGESVTDSNALGWV